MLAYQTEPSMLIFLKIGENNELKRQLENLRRENETMQSGLSKEVGPRYIHP